MTGINHRRKNPIHSAPSSRAAKVAQLRHSHRAFQKKPFPSRMAVKEEGGIKEVMGRVVFPRQGQVKKDGKDQRGSAGSGSRGGRDVKTPVQSESENHSTLDDSAARDMTVEELLEEANLAGLPDRFRTHSEPAEERHQSSIEDHRGNDEDGMIDENDYPDGAFSMEADEGRSESSEDPLMIYPTPSWSIVVPSVVGGNTLISGHSQQAPPTAIQVDPQSLHAQDVLEPYATTNELPNTDPVSISSDAWEEAGTLSSRDNGFAEDFDAERSGFSEQREEQGMLDCSDDGKEEVDESGAQGGQHNITEEGAGVLHSMTIIEDPAPPRGLQPGANEQSQTACGEVSRFFACPIANPTKPARDTTADTTHSDAAPADGACKSAYRPSTNHGMHHPTATPMLQQDSARGPMSNGVKLALSATKNVNERIGRKSDTIMNGQSVREQKVAKQSRIIDYLDTSPSPMADTQVADYQTCTIAECVSTIPSDPDTGPALCSQAPVKAYPSTAYRQPKAFDGPMSIYRWDVPFATVKAAKHERDADDSDIESCESEPAYGRDIEAEAMEVLSEETPVDDSDEETEKENGDEEEATFEPRLLRNVHGEDTPLVWRISQWNEAKVAEAQWEQYRGYFSNDRQHHERFDGHRRRSPRLAFNASKAKWPDLFMRDRRMRNYNYGVDGDSRLPRTRVTASPEEWDVSDDTKQGDLELLGEDGLPYVFETVVSQDMDTTYDQPPALGGVVVGGTEHGDDSGVQLETATNPFLLPGDGTTRQDLHSDSVLPTFDQVVVVYNYPSTSAVSEGERQERRRELNFDEATVLQDIRAYYQGVAKMLAVSGGGNSEGRNA